MESLELVVATMCASGIRGTIWLNGSFLTEEINPSTIEFIAMVNADVYDNGTDEQRSILNGLVDGKDWQPPSNCDTNVFLFEQPGHGNSVDLFRYWQDRFGYSKDRRMPKGIVTIELRPQEQEDAEENE